MPQTATVVETREHREQLPNGTETVIVDTNTVESTVPNPPAPVAAPEEIADEIAEETGVDETWLEEKFALLSATLTTLQSQVASNQAANLETINRLMSLVETQQSSLSAMLEKVAALTPSPVLTPEPLPEVTPIAIVSPDAAPVAPVEAETASPALTRKNRRRI